MRRFHGGDYSCKARPPALRSFPSVGLNPRGCPTVPGFVAGGGDFAFTLAGPLMALKGLGFSRADR
jgi:hypothetical protein